MCSFAKLYLNSFWGKFGQRLGMKLLQFIHESEADVFFQMSDQREKLMHNFHIITPEIVQLEWSDDLLFLPTDTKTNIFLASFRTMWARLRLYSVLGEDCLYMDTDSVIFVHRIYPLEITSASSPTILHWTRSIQWSTCRMDQRTMPSGP